MADAHPQLSLLTINFWNRSVPSRPMQRTCAGRRRTRRLHAEMHETRLALRVRSPTSASTPPACRRTCVPSATVCLQPQVPPLPGPSALLHCAPGAWHLLAERVKECTAAELLALLMTCRCSSASARRRQRRRPRRARRLPTPSQRRCVLLLQDRIAGFASGVCIAPGGAEHDLLCRRCMVIMSTARIGTMHEANLHDGSV